MISWKPCREPALDELLADDIIQKMIASARIEPSALRHQMAELAQRLGDRIHPAPACLAAAN